VKREIPSLIYHENEIIFSVKAVVTLKRTDLAKLVSLSERGALAIFFLSFFVVAVVVLKKDDSHLSNLLNIFVSLTFSSWTTSGGRIACIVSWFPYLKNRPNLDDTG